MKQSSNDRTLQMIRISLDASEKAVPLISDFLLGLDAMGVASDINEGKGYQVSSYFPTTEDMDSILAKIKNHIEFLKKNFSGIQTGSLKTERIDSSSWDGWKKALTIVRAGQRVVIRPPWKSYSPQTGEIVIEINPGGAFGTGHHETTRLCVRAMEEIILKREIKKAVDVGCGSGVLSISAAKLGIAEVLAFDTDPVATRESKKNARINAVSPQVKVFCGHIESVDGEFDLVVVNITARAIILMKEQLKKKLSKDGNLIVSGVPETKKGEVVQALTGEGFVLDKLLSEEDWVALILRID